MFKIVRAGFEDAQTVAAEALKLWPHHTIDELAAEVVEQIANGKNAFFLAKDGSETIGFCHVSLRADYVEGASSSPCGFLEGIYVAPEHRRMGAAKALLAAGEQWSAECGCMEIGSDRELANEVSEGFHLGVGFEETERTVWYLKSIEGANGTVRSGGFWESLDKLAAVSEMVIDRPAGSIHPRFPAIRYPYDYGYLKGTSAMDGGGIDVWRGSRSDAALDAVIVTVDMMKKDSEIKLLFGCTEEEKTEILRFHNDGPMSGILIRR